MAENPILEEKAMRTRSKLTTLAVAAAGLGAVAGPATAPAAVQRAALSEFEGKVVSVNRDAMTFRLRDAERGTFRIRVTANTRYERVDGLAGVRRNLRLEVVAKRSKGRWVATEVEKRRPGSGDNHDD
jgi:predicted secreted protein